MFEGAPVIKIKDDLDTTQSVVRNYHVDDEPSLATLRSFIDKPISPAEVQTKEDFRYHILPWLAKALLDAKFDIKEIDKLLADSEDVIDFNRDATLVAADINSMINDFYNQASAEAVEEKSNVVPFPVANNVAAVEAATPKMINPDAPQAVAETMSVDTTSYLSQLEKINQGEFSHDAYIEFIYRVNAESRSKYDEACISAKNNLTKFSYLYTPSKSEKEALQLFSSIQAQHVKMGVVRAEIVSSLEHTDTNLNIAEIRQFAENYVVASDALMVNINKLENIVALAKTEEKPPLAEAYRAQLEKIRVEGNQVLATLPIDHVMYERLKVAMDSDLVELVNFAAAEKGGDTNVLQQSSNFIVRRDKIKDLISFIKVEQEFEDYKNNANMRLRKLELLVDKVSSNSEEARAIKISIKSDLNQVSELLTEPTLYLITEKDKLEKRKQEIKILLGGIKESISKFINSDEGDTGETSSIEINQPAEKLPPLLLNKLESAAKQAVATLQNRDAEIRALVPESVKKKSKNLLPHFDARKIGKIAAMVASLYSLPASNSLNQAEASRDILIPGMPIISSGIASIPTPEQPLDYSAITNYLRAFNAETAHPVTENTFLKNAPKPHTLAYQVPLAVKPTEVVPGVAFSEDTLKIPDYNEVSNDPEFKIYSQLADVVQPEGIVFQQTQNPEAKKFELKPYVINIGDKFWDINKSQSLAGKLPVMSQISHRHTQALINLVRDKINRDPSLRAAIGGMRDSAYELDPGKVMNLNLLNDTAVSIAIESGMLV